MYISSCGIYLFQTYIAMLCLILGGMYGGWIVLDSEGIGCKIEIVILGEHKYIKESQGGLN